MALLKSWWDPKSPNCRFQHYFYNVVSPQEAHLYQKPADHDQAAWDAAQAANPDRTTRVPALAIGFDDVQKRMDEQHKLSEAHSAKLAEIETMIKEIQKKSQLETAVKLEEYKRKHMQAAQRVIKVSATIRISMCTNKANLNDVVFEICSSLTKQGLKYHTR